MSLHRQTPESDPRRTRPPGGPLDPKGRRAVTDEQRSYLQALSDVRAWHRWKIGQSIGDVRTMQAHEEAIAWLNLLIATKTQHAPEDKKERYRDQRDKLPP